MNLMYILNCSIQQKGKRYIFTIRVNDKSVRRNIMFIKLCTSKCTRQPGECTRFRKKRSSFAPLSDYGKTTNEGCEMLRFALFCKKCSTTGVIKLKNISPQYVPKHGVFGHFEKGKS